MTQLESQLYSFIQGVQTWIACITLRIRGYWDGLEYLLVRIYRIAGWGVYVCIEFSVPI